MAGSNNLTSLLAQLEELKSSKDYLKISNTLDDHFHSRVDDIITKWISDGRLSKDETRLLDLYSFLQLSSVEYCLFHSGITEDIRNIISQFRKKLFRVGSTNKLSQAVEFIRQEHVSNRSEDDVILVYIMRMIDARSYAYRVDVNCTQEMPPRQLYTELYDCLMDRHGKKFLNDVKSKTESREKIVVSNRHKFFLGCSTYAVALFPDYKDELKDSNQVKYIYLLAKYVRVMLRQINFEQNPAVLYCLRGILALLNNCVPTKNWIHIINKALANESDVAAQQANPFNFDLFSLIVNRLLGSRFLRDQAIRTDSYNVTSLADTALIFLNKWFGTSIDRDADDDLLPTTSGKEEPSEVLRLLRSDEQFNATVNSSQIIRPYIDAKFDRLRFMAVAVLSSLASFEDFDQLQKKRINIWKGMVSLIFQFIHQAEAHESKEYKGISLRLLLRYLLRLIIQDGAKKETLPHVPQIIEYARQGELDAFRILRRISTNPESKEKLLVDEVFQQFINTEANTRFDHQSNMYKYVERIRENLRPVPTTSVDAIPQASEGRQAFISYSHDDREQCDEFVRVLRSSGVFTKIWIDYDNVQGNIIDSIVSGIRQSEVVFVLLSDAYCRSGTCRREWEFADSYNKAVYPVFVQQGFKRKTYDWVSFLIRSDLYHKFHEKDDLQRLIHSLQRRYKDEKVPKDVLESPSTETLTVPHSLPSDRDSTTKQFIAQWTRDDVQSWCRNNKFDQWCGPLAQYDGHDLLDLNKVLKKNAYLQHIAASHQIPFLDVVKFRGELRKLVSGSVTTPKTTTKKSSSKHRVLKLPAM